MFRAAALVGQPVDRRPDRRSARVGPGGGQAARRPAARPAHTTAYTFLAYLRMLGRDVPGPLEAGARAIELGAGRAPRRSGRLPSATGLPVDRITEVGVLDPYFYH